MKRGKKAAPTAIGLRDARRLGLAGVGAFALATLLTDDQPDVSKVAYLGAGGLIVAAGARLDPLRLGATATALLLLGIALSATGSPLGAWLDATALVLGVLAAHRMGRAGADEGTVGR